MNDLDIVFSKFEFPHGINKPTIFIFQENDSKEFYILLNRQIEQLKIKTLFNVGNEELKEQLNATITEQLNPKMSDMIELALKIKEHLFDKIENVGIISGPLVNNSLKLYLIFLHKHEGKDYQKTQEYGQLTEYDKIELQQNLNSVYSKPQLIPQLQSCKFSSIISAQQNEISQDNESQIINRESNQQSQLNGINSNTTKTVSSNYVPPLHGILSSSEVKTDQILTSKEQTISQPFYPSKINQPYMSEIQDSIISNFAPPIIPSYDENKQQMEQVHERKKEFSTQFVESNDQLASPIVKLDAQQHQMCFEVQKVAEPPKKKEYQLPDPIKFPNFLSSDLKCLQ